MTDETAENKGGRPTKLTLKIQEKICEYIAAGNYLITACKIAGISKQTYQNWLRRGEEEADKGEGRYLGFMFAVKKAEGEAESKMVQIVCNKAINDKEWLPAMTYLERRFPDRWGRKDRTAVTIDDHKRVTITHVEVVKDYGQGGRIVESEAREVPELPAPKEGE